MPLLFLFYGWKSWDLKTWVSSWVEELKSPLSRSDSGAQPCLTATDLTDGCVALPGVTHRRVPYTDRSSPAPFPVARAEVPARRERPWSSRPRGSGSKPGLVLRAREPAGGFRSGRDRRRLGTGAQWRHRGGGRARRWGSVTAQTRGLFFLFVVRVSFSPQVAVLFLNTQNRRRIPGDKQLGSSDPYYLCIETHDKNNTT